METMWVRLLEPVIDLGSQSFWDSGQIVELSTAFGIKLVNAGKAVEYHVPGGVIVADNAMSDSSVNPIQNMVVKRYIDELTKWELPEGMTDNVDIPGNSRKLIVIPVLGDQSLLEIDSFRKLDIQNASTDGAGRDMVVLQGFGTTNQRRSAQVAVVNLSSEPAKIKVAVTALARKVPQL